MSKPARIALSAISLLAAGALLVALPYLVGVNWQEILRELRHLSTLELLGLAALWLAGLWAYTYVLTASLPGLTHVHAFMLNAVGSAVSNLLPFGGAAGVAVTFGMARGWGHRNAEITVSTLVTGVWNVMSRLLLPAVGIAALLVAGKVPDGRMAAMAGTAGLALLGIVALLAVALRSESAAQALDRGLLRLADRVPAKSGALVRRAGGALLDVRHKSVAVLRTGWLGLTGGMAAYLLLQALLLVGCLVAVGADIGPAEVIAVFAINRMLTTAVVTPSGAGISETGTAALLVRFGVDPAVAAAATILYSFFTYAIEIPVGGAAWAGWTVRRGRRAPPLHIPAKPLVKK